MPNNRIDKVLIANRGEIALRIQRTCERLGIKTVSVVSEADKNLYFARSAEKAVVIGPAPAKESYLKGDKIIETALKEGCQAIHPGYGFLSENGDFAQAVINAGLIFIGPSPKSINDMGHKTRAKELVLARGVPCARSSAASPNVEELVKEGERIRYPLLVKAAAGGGGRGMRIVRERAELHEAITRASLEAEKFFGNAEVFLERYIERPRHVEVQIFGDSHGNLIHLGTRDCSSQRRHQKIIEEAPAPNLSPALRAAIQEAGLQAAKSVDYKGAGTVEFLVKGEEFFFLEMNTRLQVEHPVTEMITGLDLVELQILVARGEKLPIKQSEVKFSGHAIQFRVNAEDPANAFSPVKGTITSVVRIAGEEEPQNSVREDFGFDTGDQLSMHYDSLLSKVIVFSETRGKAIEKSIAILKGYRIEGVTTSLAYHRWALYNNEFRQGPVDIGFIEREFSKESLRELEVLDLRDPRWREPIGAAEMTESYKYKSEKYNETYIIEILHNKDGFFVAAPVDSQGKRAKNSNRRMSSHLDTALKSLIDEVLEQQPPSVVFS